MPEPMVRSCEALVPLGKMRLEEWAPKTKSPVPSMVWVPPSKVTAAALVPSRSPMRTVAPSRVRLLRMVIDPLETSRLLARVTAERVPPDEVATSWAPSVPTNRAPESVPPWIRSGRELSISATVAVPESVIAAVVPVASITAVSAGPGRTSPTQLTASRKFVPHPSLPPSQWTTAIIARPSRPSIPESAPPRPRRETARLVPKRRRPGKRARKNDQERGKLRMAEGLVPAEGSGGIGGSAESHGTSS